MEKDILGQNLSDNNYEDYIKEIVDIFRLSSQKSSILFDLKIENYQAVARLSILNQNGKREEFKNVVLNCDNSFYHNFLMPLVREIYVEGNIATADIVHLANQDLVTFRMITTNNDLFSVDGLSKDDAKALLMLCDKSMEETQMHLKISNREGKGSALNLLLLIIVIFIIFGILIIFLHN